jgi:hypothetical protein
VTNSTDNASKTKPIGIHRTLHALWTQHGGSRALTNVVLTERGGEIKFDPHATGSCVITLDEDAASAVRDTITEWLG